jgi:hypothetical protein
MSTVYPWLVFAHIAGVVLFVAAHGVSMFAAFSIRGQRDPRAVAVLLTASKRAVALAYVGLLLLVVGGVGAAIMAGVMDRLWTIGSIVILVVVMSAMYGMATTYYIGIRGLVGDGLEQGGEDSPVVDRATLHARLESRRPELLVVVGGSGLAILVWLMVFKPG